MPQDWYEVLVISAQYLFVLLCAIIVWRSFGWLRTESRQHKRAMRALPDAGFIGELYVLQGEGKNLHAGDAFSIPAEGVLGSARGCDVRIPHASVAARHALFEFHKDGLHLRPRKDDPLSVDGQAVPPGCRAVLQHGAVLAVGMLRLQLRLFAGVELEDEWDAPAGPEEEREAVSETGEAPEESLGQEMDEGLEDLDGLFEELPEGLPDDLPGDEAGGIFRARGTYVIDEAPRHSGAPDDNPIYGNMRRRRR